MVSVMKKCIHCGREVPEDSTYCPYCGNKADKAEDKIDLSDYGPHDQNGEPIRSHEEEKPSLNDYGQMDSSSSSNKENEYHDPRYGASNDNGNPTYPTAMTMDTGRILGILSLVFGCLGGWIGIILGAIGLFKSKDKGTRTMCIIGIILGLIMAVIDILVIVYVYLPEVQRAMNSLSSM
jgi:endogenous inhibitor of DNA gyrase (YacG/DUF329 family)